MTHRCHYPPCDTPTPPRLLVCPRHWRLVPPALRDAVYQTYYAGHRAGTHPTLDWQIAAQEAFIAIAAAEGDAAEEITLRARLLFYQRLRLSRLVGEA